MWPTKMEQEYQAVPREDYEGMQEKQNDGEAIIREEESTIYDISRSIGILFVAAFVCSIFVWLSLHSGGDHSRLQVGAAKQYASSSRKPCTASPSTHLPPPSAPIQTQECPQRKEWRTLTTAEQKDYISAVLCLKDLYSNITSDPRMSAYDDFPWIHSHVGYSTHNSASFLPWHRYFLHIYETTLRERCAYRGALTYWDWTLDSKALEKSPVFDPETGFGGDGEVGGDNTVGRTGRCVVDGPFAMTNVSYYDIQYKPHCLSRGFRDSDGNLGRMDGRDSTPDAIEEILSTSESYETFVTLMEAKVHDAIPFGIAGDFETFTAPYDPLFFLHHTQLDRLWWMWQQRQPGKGLKAYDGRRQRHSVEKARLDDWLYYKGLAPKVQVKDVMDIEGETLCYRY